MFIDIHVHASNYSSPLKNGKAIGGNTPLPKPETILAFYDKLGIGLGCLQPLIGPEVYLPQSNEHILEICNQYPDRFVPFCNVDPRALTNSTEAPFEDLLYYYRDRGFKGFGEFMPNLHWKDPLVQHLMKSVEAVGFPLLFDANGKLGGTYGLYDEPGMPQLEYCLQKFPKLKILGHGPAFWAEIGQLEPPFDRYPKTPIKEAGAVVKLMSKYPNLFADLSAGSGFNAMNRDKMFATTFINQFQDRLLFGTDICSDDLQTPILNLLYELKANNNINEAVFMKIMRENAIRVFDLGMLST